MLGLGGCLGCNDTPLPCTPGTRLACEAGIEGYHECLDTERWGDECLLKAEPVCALEQCAQFGFCELSEPIRVARGISVTELAVGRDGMGLVFVEVLDGSQRLMFQTLTAEGYQATAPQELAHTEGLVGNAHVLWAEERYVVTWKMNIAQQQGVHLFDGNGTLTARTLLDPLDGIARAYANNGEYLLFNRYAGSSFARLASWRLSRDGKILGEPLTFGEVVQASHPALVWTGERYAAAHDSVGQFAQWSSAGERILGMPTYNGDNQTEHVALGWNGSHYGILSVERPINDGSTLDPDDPIFQSTLRLYEVSLADEIIAVQDVGLEQRELYAPELVSVPGGWLTTWLNTEEDSNVTHTEVRRLQSGREGAWDTYPLATSATLGLGARIATDGDDIWIVNERIEPGDTYDPSIDLHHFRLCE